MSRKRKKTKLQKHLDKSERDISYESRRLRAISRMDDYQTSLVTNGPFQSKYPVYCSICKETHPKGTMIKKTPDGSDYIAIRCQWLLKRQQTRPVDHTRSRGRATADGESYEQLSKDKMCGMITAAATGEMHDDQS